MCPGENGGLMLVQQRNPDHIREIGPTQLVMADHELSSMIRT
jgi:hypothetical protein